ncbi:MAG: class I SAM-dependent methyltransferase [Alphaproteobacteria bacterium]|nr:class I SAM-dependent methyltransferase [Alphaproteobacteria bacterium]
MDFLDVGCSNGGSIRWASGAFGGHGLGIDVSPAKVASARAKGFDAVVADARQLPFPESHFRYAVLSNILEHLPDRDYAFDCVSGVWRCVRDFVVVTGPNFDHEPYLRSLGYKRYWADWSGHTWHHRTADFRLFAERLQPTRHAVLETGQVADSFNRTLLPLSAKRNQGTYDPTLHGTKEFIRFDGAQRVFETIIAVFAKSAAVDLFEVCFKMLAPRVVTLKA